MTTDPNAPSGNDDELPGLSPRVASLLAAEGAVRTDVPDAVRAAIRAGVAQRIGHAAAPSSTSHGSPGAAATGTNGTLASWSLGLRGVVTVGVLALTGGIMLGVAIGSRLGAGAEGAMPRSQGAVEVQPVAVQQPSSGTAAEHAATEHGTSDPRDQHDLSALRAAAALAAREETLRGEHEREGTRPGEPRPRTAEANADPDRAAASPPPEPPSAENADDAHPSTRSSLADEARILEAAKAALSARSASTALDALDRHASRYPDGLLAEERDALRIRTLLALARTDEARELAERFLRAYPQSAFVGMARAALRATP